MRPVAKRNSGHLREIRQIGEPFSHQQRVERRVLDPHAEQHKHPRCIEQLRREESVHSGSLRCGEGRGLRREPMSLRADVFSYKRRELRDLFRRQLGRCHLLDPRADRGCLPHPAPVPPDALLGWQTRVSSLLNCCTESAGPSTEMSFRGDVEASSSRVGGTDAAILDPTGAIACKAKDLNGRANLVRLRLDFLIQVRLSGLLQAHRPSSHHVWQSQLAQPLCSRSRFDGYSCVYQSECADQR